MKQNNNLILNTVSIFQSNGIGQPLRWVNWARYFAAATIIVAILVIAGWQFNIDLLKRPIANLVAMNPATAISFILCGFSFLLLKSKISSPGKLRLGKLLAGIVMLIGLLRFISVIPGVDFHVDRLLFESRLTEDLATAVSSRMAFTTAFNFILLGLALFFLNVEISKKIMPAHIISLFINFIVLLSIIGYLYRVQAFYGILVYLPMAIHSAICFLFLSLAILFANPGMGIMKELTSQFSGSFIARFLVPAAIIIPAMLGLMRLLGSWTGTISLEMGTALLVLSNIIIFLVLSWLIIVSLNKRDRKKLETDNALRASESQVQSIFNAAPDPVILFDEEGKIVKWNPKAELVFGWTANEVTGKRLSDIIIPPRYTEEQKKEVAIFLGTGKTFVPGHTLEIQALDKKNNEIDVSLSISPTTANEKHLSIVFIRDITEKKIAEEKLLKFNQELEQKVTERTIEIENLNAELEQKVAERTIQLETANRELEAFSYSISHDLRAPLRGIVGFAAILEEDYGSKLDDEARRITSVIRNNTLRMGNLIDDLLTFSRMGRQDIIKNNISTDQLVNEIIAELGNGNQRITWNTQSLPDTYGDINTIRQVWINLISNAIKYSRNTAEPVVEIGHKNEPTQIIFYVKDNGVGFDSKYMDKLFKVFQRLHSANEFEGTGVGLAIVEKIITKHGGKVWAEGEKDKGACFYFSLPLK